MNQKPGTCRADEVQPTRAYPPEGGTFEILPPIRPPTIDPIVPKNAVLSTVAATQLCELLSLLHQTAAPIPPARPSPTPPTRTPSQR